MKKAVIISSILFSFFAIFGIANAATFNRAFGGKIRNEEAQDITKLESSGFTCEVPGDTFDLIPVYGSTGPYLVTMEPRGGGAASPGRWTLGLAGMSKTTIAFCTNIETYQVRTVEGYTITVWGVSKI